MNCGNAVVADSSGACAARAVLGCSYALREIGRDGLKVFEVPGVDEFRAALPGALQEEGVVDAPARKPALGSRLQRVVVFGNSQRDSREAQPHFVDEERSLFGRDRRFYRERREDGEDFGHGVQATGRILGCRGRKQFQAGLMVRMTADEGSDQNGGIEKQLHFESSRMRSARTASISSCRDSVSRFALFPPWYTHTPRSFFSVARVRTGRSSICSSACSTNNSSPASRRSLSRTSLGRTTRPALSREMAFMDAIL